MFEYHGNTYCHVAVFGVGEYFKRKKKYIETYITIENYVDNDKNKIGIDLFEDGITCIAPGEIKKNEIDFLIIGVDKPKIQDELINQVKELEIPFCMLNEIIDLFIDKYDSKRKKQSEEMVKEFFYGKEGNHRLVLVNTPQVSSTIGDHAISTAELLFIKKNFSDRTLIEIGDVFFWENKDEIKRHIVPSDTILIQGGGYMGSLWRFRREDTIRYILQTYTKNKIIILPMTMFFEDSKEGKLQCEISKIIYNSHDNLTICFREKKSFELSKTILKNKIKTYLIPDTVISLNYKAKSKSKKRGIAIFFKNDKETILSDQDQVKLRKWISLKGHELFNITMFYPESINSAEEREKIIFDKLDELAGFEMIITDAMHGMVLAAVSGTSCIGVESLTGKVRGIYEWLKPLPYVEYANTYDEICIAIDKLFPIKTNKYENAYLNNYFDKLKELIE